MMESGQAGPIWVFLCLLGGYAGSVVDSRQNAGFGIVGHSCPVVLRGPARGIIQQARSE